MNLEHLRLFQRIVELGSMAAAARETGLSTTTVSERLAALEERFEVALLNRTTRSISLTDAGRTLLDGIEPLLEDSIALEAKIKHGVETLSGLIRVSAPSDIGRSWLAGALGDFQTLHPQVQLELDLSDRPIDIVGEGFDIALRHGVVADSSLRVKRLSDGIRIVCATPEYLSEHGQPDRPSDLVHHKCLLMRYGDMLDNHWTFGLGPMSETVVVQGHRISNDGHQVKLWCLAGSGIALKSEFDIGEELASGQLIRLFEGYEPTQAPLQLLFPPNKRQPTRVKSLSDFLSKAARKSLRRVA
ncbi:MAG: LysR family transcriptional regulator [Pseudomonadota bacterium]